MTNDNWQLPIEKFTVLLFTVTAVSFHQWRVDNGKRKLSPKAALNNTNFSIKSVRASRKQ